MSILKKIGNALKNAWTWVKKTWTKVDELADKICPIAVEVVNKIKEINDSKSGDVIELVVSSLIPGTKDDAIIKALRVWLKDKLPVIATQLNIVSAIASIEDPNQQLIAICNAINISPDNKTGVLYRTMAARIIEYLSDGKITLSEAWNLAQEYYDLSKIK